MTYHRMGSCGPDWPVFKRLIIPTARRLAEGGDWGAVRWHWCVFLMTLFLDLAGPLLGMTPQKVTCAQLLLDKGIPYGNTGTDKTWKQSKCLAGNP